MKKFYSFVLMAMMLLISTNVSAANVAQIVGGGTYETLEDAFADATNGQTIEMLDNYTLTQPINFGKATSLAEYTAAHKVVTLDFKGKTVTMDDVNGTVSKGKKNGIAQSRMFTVYSGALKLVNSTPAAGGGLHHTYNYGAKYFTIAVYGSIKKDCDPSDDKEDKLGYYTYLSIGEGVNIVSDGAKGGICVMILPSGVAKDSRTGGNTDLTDAQKIWNGYTNHGSLIYTNDSPTYPFKNGGYGDPRGVANGVRIDVYGHLEGSMYAMQSNGQLAGPDSTFYNTGHGNTYIHYYEDKGDIFYGGTAPGINANDKNYAPYIHIYDGAQLTNTENASLKSNQVALYTSGYARWYVEGSCEGTTGVYMKSGDVTLNNAVVTSTSTDEATLITGATKGVNGGGNAIVVESNDHYSGHINLNILGETEVSTEAENGTALFETIADGNNSEVEHISINGGTLSGDQAIVVSDATATEDKVQVMGGNLEGAAVVTDMNDIINPATAHATTVTNADGSTTIVVSAGTAPTGVADFDSNATASVKWTGSAKTISEADFKLKELEINEATAQILEIADGAVLTVERVILGEYAKIIVKAGGKLIVTGNQGINANIADNLILETQEGNPALFVFSPAVKFNRHPKATVEFISKSYTKSSSDFAFQRFGIPTNGEIETISTKYGSDDVATAFMSYDYDAQQWVNIGYINAAGKPALDKSKLASPFDYYQMQHNTPLGGTVVTMTGTLIGNEIPQLHVRGNFWNGFANSCTGNMSMKELVENSIPNTVDKAIYLYDINATKATWEPFSLLVLDEKDSLIQPLQPFLIRNSMDAADVTVDYGNAVYYPTTGEPKPGAGAPRRRVLSDITKAKLIVSGENCTDRVIVAEGAQFSAEFDNGYDAAKFMNDGINMYVSAAEKMSLFATDNLDNTYVGFQTVNGGLYTIEFANVRGEELTLIDLETGARVAMVEGNAYEFTAAANTVNDYRFKIVESAKLPTAIDNTEAVKSIKGIYTITGQYLGEMNVWNTLPAGVYVVNGEKRVK